MQREREGRREAAFSFAGDAPTTLADGRASHLSDPGPALCAHRGEGARDVNDDVDDVDVDVDNDADVDRSAVDDSAHGVEC
jgi:hypothetical protein